MFIIYLSCPVLYLLRNYVRHGYSSCSHVYPNKIKKEKTEVGAMVWSLIFQKKSCLHQPQMLLFSFQTRTIIFLWNHHSAQPLETPFPSCTQNNSSPCSSSSLDFLGSSPRPVYRSEFFYSCLLAALGSLEPSLFYWWRKLSGLGCIAATSVGIKSLCTMISYLRPFRWGLLVLQSVLLACPNFASVNLLWYVGWIIHCWAALWPRISEESYSVTMELQELNWERFSH